MTNQYALSGITKQYLSRFYEILDTMIHEMTNADLTDSISHNFIVQMIPHHRAAIEMSESVLRCTAFAPVQKIAARIIVEQTKSIENMLSVLNCCGETENTGMDLALYMRRFYQIVQVMFTDMDNACADNDISADFMREMIPHHKGAIRMSENALQFPICPELRPILSAIITSQQAGVREMECLLKYSQR